MTAVILDYPHSRESSHDLFACAVSDILESNGLRCEFRSLHDFDRGKEKDTVWIIIRSRKMLVPFPHAPPEGLKILFNCSRLSGNLKAGRYSFPVLDTTVYVREFPMFSNFRFRSHTRRMKGKTVDRGWVDIVFDYNPHNILAWESMGVRAVFVPTGWHERFVFRPQYELNGISFLGKTSDERRKILIRRIESKIGQPIALPNRKNGGRSVINRLRTSLHLHGADDYWIFPDRRMMLLGSNARTIVSEICDWTPFTKDHWVECSEDLMPGVCRRAIDGEFDSFGSSVLEFFKNKFRFENHLTRALRIVGVIE